MEIYTRQKLCHFGRYVAKAELFRLNSCVPVTRAGVFIWENFHSGYRDLGRKTRDLGNRASLASHMNTSKFLRRKEKRGEISETGPARSIGLIWRGLEPLFSGNTRKREKVASRLRENTAIHPERLPKWFAEIFPKANGRRVFDIGGEEDFKKLASKRKQI